jgi:hypothetical protein
MHTLSEIVMTDEADAMVETSDLHLRMIVKPLVEGTRMSLQDLVQIEASHLLPVLLPHHLHLLRCRHRLHLL